MLTALIVEDNVMNRKLLRDILETRFRVWEAGSGEEALEFLKSKQPDVIFMDLQLPGIDGVTCIRRLKAARATASIPIVAISAHAMQDNIDEAHAAGCTEYVTKPLIEEPDAFADRMAALVEDPFHAQSGHSLCS